MAELFKISPLIRVTLLGFYLALTIPLPLLAEVTNAPISENLLWLGLGLGFVFLYGVLSERVRLDEVGIAVIYPQWFAWLMRRGWSLAWSEVVALKMRTTGQGGLVYYFVTAAGDRAYLLPMRIAGFAKMVQIVTDKTQIETKDIRPLAQPWMYGILFGLTLILLAIDVWIINAFHTAI